MIVGMTEEQQRLLSRRLQEATQQQPEIMTLRALLLARGGMELVAPPTLDADMGKLIEEGSDMVYSVVFNLLDEGRCHENAAELWSEGKECLSGIGTGYALSADGLWRRHSWIVRPGEIVETTEERVKYFGRLLEGADADAFAEDNKGDPEERRWRRLPKVYFKLEKDEDGYPPEEWEGLKAEPVEEPETYRIKSVPFYASQVAYGDEVRTCTSDEGFFPVFKAVSRRSGFSTVRLWLAEAEDRSTLADFFSGRGCLVEFDGRLMAIGIPKTAFEDISEYIAAEKDRGRWDAQDGYLVIDD